MLIGIDGNEANIQNRVGVNQYAFDLLHAIRKLDISDQFIIYLKNPPQADLPSESLNWHYRVIPFPALWTQTRLPFDLYTHSPRPDVFFTPSHYAPRSSPIPTVISVMDLGFLNTPEQFTPKDFNQLKLWTRYSIKQAKKIITISEFSKSDIIKNYQYPESNITVTYPGYDSDLFKPVENPAVQKKYGITSPYILFLSSLKPNKNVEGLIHAIAQLKNPTLTLVIAGKKAWLYDRIFQLVRDLKLSSRVVFTGFVDEAEVPVLMSQAKAFVLPSFHEGFGIPVVEAMACGTPVVISKVASLPEVAGDAGIYVDPANISSITRGIQIALSAKRSGYVKKGLTRVNKFDWQKTARNTLAVIRASKSVE
jgi:glycosyltransferase involved in cell wall biosynthesis